MAWPTANLAGEASVYLATTGGVVLVDRQQPASATSEPVLDDWKIRLPVWFNLFDIEGGPSAAWGAQADVRFALSLLDQSTEPFEGAITLVEVPFNPEAR